MTNITTVSPQNVVRCEPDAAERLVNEFLADSDLKEISRHSYRKKLLRFFQWCRTHGVQQPDRQTILRYKRELMDHGHSAFTISGYLVPIRCMYRWLSALHPLFPNPTTDLRGAKRPNGHCRDAFSVEQVTQVLGAIDRSTLIGKRDHALIGLLARCGLRTCEITRAVVGDIRRMGDETILFVQSKGADAKTDMAILTPNTIKPIMEYLIARGSAKPSDPLFASLSDGSRGAPISTRTIRHITKQRARACGIDSPHLSAHSYRHFYCTTAVDSGVPLDEVREAARHASLTSTQIYIHRGNRKKGITEKKIDEVLQAELTKSTP